MSDTVQVRGNEFIRRVHRHAKDHGLSFEWRPDLGKGSHGILILGDRRTVVRNPKDELFLETSMPELFACNADVTGVGSWFDAETVVDFDLLNDAGFDSHIMDLYALSALGDCRLLSRRMVLEGPAQKTEPLILAGEVFASRHPDILQSISSRFSPISVLAYDPSNIEGLRSLLTFGRLYVGCDEDITWMAMTADIPIVMLTGPRVPKNIRPFRVNIPFEPIACKCEFMSDCVKRFSSSGFGNLYHVFCRREPIMACESLVCCADVESAAARILANG